MTKEMKMDDLQFATRGDGAVMVLQPTTGLWVPRFVDAKIHVEARSNFSTLIDRVRWGRKRKRVPLHSKLSLWDLLKLKFLDERGMAGSFMPVLEVGALDAVFGSGTPSSFYFWASTTDPGNDGSGKTEPAGDGYARKEETNNATLFPGASGSDPAETLTDIAILFPEATGSWGNIAYLGAADDPSAGDDYIYGDITGGAVAVGANQILRVPAGDCSITLA